MTIAATVCITRKYRSCFRRAFVFKIMAGFDQGAVYYSDSLFNQTGEQDTLVNLQYAKQKFKEFIRQFNDGGLAFKYR